MGWDALRPSRERHRTKKLTYPILGTELPNLSGSSLARLDRLFQFLLPMPEHHGEGRERRENQSRHRQYHQPEKYTAKYRARHESLRYAERCKI